MNPPFFLSLLFFTTVCLAETPAKVVRLPRSIPVAQGVAAGALVNLVETLDAQVEGMHSFMLLRHGQVITEAWWQPFSPEENHICYSLSKSFTSTAVGLAVAEGKLSIDDPVLKFFPEDAPAEVSANLQAMKVRDILSMSAGHETESSLLQAEMSAKSFLAHPVPRTPGSHFKYNTPATFMQSAIVQKLTGMTVLDYLAPRLFQPLGITTAVWDKNFQGINLGGYGLRVRTEDIAKLGQLYLQKGEWQGRQILSPDWVAQATRKQVANGTKPNSDWSQGYGFQFWRCQHNGFRGDGAFGQYCIVLPDQDMVVAITSGIKDMQQVLNLLWEKLLPAAQKEPVEKDAAAEEKLASFSKKLVLKHAKGQPGSAKLAEVSGKSISFAANDQHWEALTLTAAGDQQMMLTAKVGGKTWSIPCGHSAWLKSRGPLFLGRLANFEEEPIAASYGWTAENVCEVKLCGYQTPFTLTLELGFTADGVTMDAESNVAFGPAKAPSVKGTLLP